MTILQSRSKEIYSLCNKMPTFTIQQLEDYCEVAPNNFQHLVKSEYIQYVKGTRPRYFKLAPCSEEEFLKSLGIDKGIIKDSTVYRPELPNVLKALKVLRTEIPSLLTVFEEWAPEGRAFNYDDITSVTIAAQELNNWCKYYSKDPRSKAADTRYVLFTEDM